MWSENANFRQPDGSWSRIQRDLHDSSPTTKHLNNDHHESTSTTSPMTPLHIAIVGAGFAGLRCADILLQNGHQVTIFEARNRLGGRVAQSDFGGHLVDLYVRSSPSPTILSLFKPKD